jgi:branched-chain amino acid aminotransferase
VKKIVFNGKMLDEGTPVVSSSSRGLRFGDGCFETMKMVNGKLVLKELHFERLFSSLDILGFEIPKHFSAGELEEQILTLAKKNRNEQLGRIRLTVFGSNGGLFDAESCLPNFIIESYELSPTLGEFNENGLVIDVFRDARKAADNFSHIKSNSFLPYVQAVNWAKKKQLNDAVVLNAFDRIADTTIANLFIVSDGIIKTPALSEGCIAGVMRKHLLKSCRDEGLPIEETQITVDDLQNANEVFLTNIIRGVKWVKSVGDAGYTFKTSDLLYNKFIKPLWQ